MTLEYLEITEDMKKLKKQHRKQVAAARRDLFNLTSEIYKCLVINNNLLTRERD